MMNTSNGTISAPSSSSSPAVNPQSPGIKTYFKTPEGNYKLHYEKTHSSSLLHYAHGKTVTQVTLAQLKERAAPSTPTGTSSGYSAQLKERAVKVQSTALHSQIIIKLSCHLQGILEFLTGGEDDLVQVWSMEDRKVLAWGEGHNSWVSGVAFDSYWSSPNTDGSGEHVMYRFGSVGLVMCIPCDDYFVTAVVLVLLGCLETGY
ncbi:hypothetical protein Bca52824_019837 [Brassica carinata]|uniref:Uncharacterized protein n=1 Tax=Brassica carinata TaxID=52824 RepID=A0A8X7VSX7_BRACI|nr:hypothetical protein Bca52824_019837 [Brassica carinata]